MLAATGIQHPRHHVQQHRGSRVSVGLYMQQVLHCSAAKAGVAFLPFALGVIVAAGMASPLAPKVGPRVVMTAGLLIAGAGLLWLTQIGVHTSYRTHLLPQQIVMSLGMGLAFPALSSTALTNVRPEDAGVASSLLSTAQQVGASLGAALLNTIAATAMANCVASHGTWLAQQGLVHGFTVALAVGPASRRRAQSSAPCFLRGPTRVRPNPAATG